MSNLSSLVLIAVVSISIGPQQLFSQTEFSRDISGTILDAKTDEPLSSANVFIANSLLGDASDDAGRFLIRDVPFETFELIVSVIGYDVEKRSIERDDRGRDLVIRLTPRIIEVPEIEISAEKMEQWRDNLHKFTELFLGTSRNAQECTILNPEVLDFIDEQNSQPFTATASEPLEIENLALGYQISLVLDQFSSQNGEVKYIVYAKFSEMDLTDESEMQKWRRNRLRTYNGSQRHFLKALFLNRYEQEGFLIQNLTSPTFGEQTRRLGEATRATLLSKGSHPSERILRFPEILEVTYVPELEEEAYIDFRLQHDFSLIATTQAMRTRAKEPLNQKSWLELQRPSIAIDKNGRVSDPLALKAHGYWGWERIAEMLPLEYEGYFRDRPDTPMVFDMPTSGPRKRHLTISAFLGFSSSGPARDVETLMTRAGFNQDSDRDFPFSVTGLENETGASWLVEVHHDVIGPLGLGIIRSDIKMGATHGRQLAQELDIFYSVSSWAIMLTMQPIKQIRLGLGPGWHSPRTGSTRAGFTNDSPKQTKFGYVADVSLLGPITPSFLAELKFQYRHLGRAEIGPYRKSGSLFVDDLPAFRSRFSHWFFGLGFGFGL